MPISACVPCAGTIRSGVVPSQAATAARNSPYDSSGYIQMFDSSSSTASRTPGNGGKRSSFRFSLTTARPYRASSSAMLGPGW